MAEDRITQRVAAILAADAVGYSRLMGADEEATIAALDRSRIVFTEHIETHQGRVVDTAGDSVLAVFDITHRAVRAAIAIQEALTEINRPLPDGARMPFRIGIHLGDVHEKTDGTVYGDGVNVAARLQALAEPNSVFVTEAIHGALRSRHEFGFTDMGDHDVKNITEPVRVYRVIMSSESPHDAPSLRSPPKRRRASVVVVVAALTIAAVAAVGLWMFRKDERVPTGAEEVTAPPVAEVAEVLPSAGPSIAVLPFTDMSEKGDHEYFADGISEDLITELSRFEGLLVIARNSTFRFKGQAVDVSEVARALGVRYVLEGGVRRAEDRVRITAQLIDTETGGHLWAERYDRQLTDVFAVQDDVTRQIISALQTEIGELAPTRGNRALTTSHEAYDLFLRARVEKGRRTPHTNTRAQDLLHQAIALDPTFAAAYAELSDAQYLAWFYGWNSSGVTLEDATLTAEKAVSLDRSSPLAHVQLGRRQMWMGRYDESIASINQAITLDANFAAGYAASAYLHSFTGDYALSLAMADKASRLDPFAVRPALYRGMVYFAQEDYEAAIVAISEGLRLNPDFGGLHQWLAAAHGQLGHKVEARAAAAEVKRLSPNYAGGLWRTPLKDRSVLLRLMDGLRKAGLEVPDEP